MNAAFWIGLGIGTALSFVASVLANLFNDRIEAFFKSRKSGFMEKRRQRSLETHRFIERIHNGKIDKYAVLIRYALGATTMGTSFFTAGAVTVAILSLDPFRENDFALLLQGNDEVIRRAVTIASLMLMSLVTAYLCFKLLFQYRALESALNDYDDYLKRINEHLGDQVKPSDRA